MGLSYILLYRHNIKIVKTTNSRCPRDPDSPSPCSCPPSWLTSSAPRRARSSPDPSGQEALGPHQVPEAPGPREQAVLHPRRQDDPHLRKGQGPCLRHGEVPQDSPDQRLNTHHLNTVNTMSGAKCCPALATLTTRSRLLLCPWPRPIAWLLTFDQHSTNH